MNLALKVDVDTYRGTLEGVPRLLDLFAKLGVVATFFFSLGPDNSGRAIRRVFRKGFVKKVLSASPAASYGWRTMLYGTLLPAPVIGERREAAARMREAAAAGHAVGIHAWDHVGWHDTLPRMTREEVFATFGLSAARFADIFGRSARLAAAPGWTANALSVEAYEADGIEISSDTRGGGPFHPLRSDGTASRVVEVPSTLPTLDELLSLPLPGAGSQVERACEFLRMRIREGDPRTACRREATGEKAATDRLAVHSIHTEIEGGPAFSAPFARLLAAWKGDGAGFLTFEDLRGALRSAGPLPERRLSFRTLPGRSTPVATGWEET